jgi:hypothetical protein
MPRRLLSCSAVDDGLVIPGGTIAGAQLLEPTLSGTHDARFLSSALSVVPINLRSERLSQALQSFHGHFTGAANVLSVLQAPARDLMRAMECLYLRGANGYDGFLGALRNELNYQIARIVPRLHGETVASWMSRRVVLDELTTRFFNTAKAWKSRASCAEW